MMRELSLVLCLCIFAVAARAEIVTPARTIRANAIITEFDVTLSEGDLAEGFDRLSDVIGQEARAVLYPGRPIRVDEIGPPALVQRNQIVPLRFDLGGLRIATEGRSLERGGLGDRVRVMNLDSRSTLFGLVQPDGSVLVYR